MEEEAGRGRGTEGKKKTNGHGASPVTFCFFKFINLPPSKLGGPLEDSIVAEADFRSIASFVADWGVD